MTLLTRILWFSTASLLSPSYSLFSGSWGPLRKIAAGVFFTLVSTCPALFGFLSGYYRDVDNPELDAAFFKTYFNLAAIFAIIFCATTTAQVFWFRKVMKKTMKSSVEELGRRRKRSGPPAPSVPRPSKLSSFSFRGSLRLSGCCTCCRCRPPLTLFSSLLLGIFQPCFR